MNAVEEIVLVAALVGWGLALYAWSLLRHALTKKDVEDIVHQIRRIRDGK